MVAFSKSPMQFCKNISNRITSIKEVLDNEMPIQLSELKRTSPAQLSAVLIKFIEGTIDWFGYKKDEMPDSRIEMLIASIMEKYYYFTIEDVCLCFKRGRENDSYDKFYGRLDCSVFLKWFAKYDKERESALQSHPSNNQTIPNLMQGIPWEQYKEGLEKRVAEGDEKAKEQLDAMESVRRKFEADRGQLFAYRYNQKHRFDPK
jgi:hypothetical protein